MNSLDEQVAYSNRVRELCMRYFMPVKLLADGKPNPDDHPTMRAEAIHATNCMCAISRVFKAIETFHPSYMMPVIVDLSFGLAENSFWKQHSGILVPVYKSSLHSAINAKVMEIAQNPNSELQSRQKKQWHSIFIVAFDALYGMAKTLDVAPIFTHEIEQVNS